MTIDELIKITKTNSPKTNPEKLRAAYDLAKKAHQGQKRISGEEFINHPLETTAILARLGLDEHTLIAALLHDVREDTNTDLKTVENKFGPHVARLVEGLTKLENIQLPTSSRSTYFVENIRKMLLAMAADIRVVLIKLADRLHNMRTISCLQSEHQTRVARETLDIYAPLANRLGMGEIKGELEDLAFPCLYPKEYAQVKNLVDNKIQVTEKYINSLKKILTKELTDIGVEVIDIHGRIKHIYSSYQKLLRYNFNIDEIYDLVAMRIIVKKEADCYMALGLLHSKWRPLPGRVRDFIASPKANGYQSLHTTVMGKEGKILEIQIRTKGMHEEAEYGVAAHWHYAETHDLEKRKSGVTIPKAQIAWVQQLIRWQHDLTDSEKFLESLKIDVFKDRIFVFTPKGDVIDLPDGATAVDFAYAIHTEIGNRCVGVKINGHLDSLETPLQNGEMVEIITAKKERGPSQDWLNFVKTAEARDKIKFWFKKINREKSLEYGRKIINRELQILNKPSIDKIKKDKIKKALEFFQLKNLDELLIALGQGDLNTNQILNKILSPGELLQPTTSKKYFFFGETVQKPRAKVGNEEGLVTASAGCCHPIPGDKIKALVSTERGAVLHRANCPNLKRGKKYGRVLEASWEPAQTYQQTKISLDCLDRVGLLRDITNVISSLGINIINISHHPHKNSLETFSIDLEVRNVDQLINTMNRLRKIKSILTVKRR